MNALFWFDNGNGSLVNGANDSESPPFWGNTSDNELPLSATKANCPLTASHSVSSFMGGEAPPGQSLSKLITTPECQSNPAKSVGEMVFVYQLIEESK